MLFLEKLKQICQEYHKRIANLEATKIDIEFEVAKKDREVRGDIIAFVTNRDYS